jgi:hypothetical protein
MFVRMELGALDMTTLGGLTTRPEINLGSFSLRFCGGLGLREIT